MPDTLQQTFSIGETVAVEFKRCDNGIPPDTYETVCAFLNRFGGDIYFGVLDDGSGVCKFFKYSRPFAGSDPSLLEGDIFQTFLALSSDWFVSDAPPNDGINTIVPINDGMYEGINDGINDGINRAILTAIKNSPGINIPALCLALGKSSATLERAVAHLRNQGFVEHRGSKKTGGYHLVASSAQTPPAYTLPSPPPPGSPC